ncbi:HugZ family protein [Acidisoma sp.]|uniref:HugZ family pyridoxamine 5'-phosphate oxidase n=1 Tax=Acidisoma sp. TaxID=1872115 RepID=UPI003B004FAF
MAEPSLSSTNTPRNEAALQARLLLRAARSAALGTVGADGLPSVTLVTPATAPDLSVLMLLSSLSEHRRNLERDGLCGLMVTGVATDANPQTAPRLSLGGRASLVPLEEDARLRQRWLAAHPYAEGYAGFLDFALWRFVPERAHFVGGFAQAHRLSLDALRPPPDAVMAVAEAEAQLLTDCDAAQAEALALAAGGVAGVWRLLAVDPDGCDLASDAVSIRVAFATTVMTAEQARAALHKPSVRPAP